MTAGLQVFNDWGTVQLDQDYISFSMSAKGTLAMTGDPANHPQPMTVGQITVTGQNPIIAFLPPPPSANGGAVHLLGRSQSGSQFTFYFSCLGQQAFGLEYWVFDDAVMGMGAGESFGLQVYRADGSLAFDSGTKPLRIVGVVDLEPSATEPSGQIVVPSGRKYAAVQGSMAIAFSHTFHSWRTGGGGSGPPLEIPDDPGGGGPGNPPSDADGQWMTDRSFHSTASTGFDGSLDCGMTKFEEFVGLHGLSETDSSTVYGDLMFWAVDVTNY